MSENNWAVIFNLQHEKFVLATAEENNIGSFLVEKSHYRRVSQYGQKKCGHILNSA